MAIAIESIEILQTYLQGVLTRSDHHAGNVRGTSLALIGAILSRATGEIRVREYNGMPANMIWFSVGSNSYMMKYNHDSQKIELHDRTNGNLVNEFNDDTPYNEIIETFNDI
jgi:hypothetical protein